MFDRFLTSFVKTGRLTIHHSNGQEIRVGEVPTDSPNLDVVLRLRNWATAWKIMLHPDLYFGEAYMDGSLVIERGSLWDLLDLCGRNLVHRRSWRQHRLVRGAQALARCWQQRNSRDEATRNVAHHYDLSDALFRTFLDADMHYSCAYFRDPELSLDEAQMAKKQHIAAKLLLEPGHRVLDIGCGWGGLDLTLAQDFGVRVSGVTLSREQVTLARKRTRAAGLDDMIAFAIRDYREIEGPFERIVSVGMFEHVGTPNYRAFFDKIAQLLTADGVALIHAIGRMDGPDLTSAWTRKYIFPGGYIPALSEVLPAIERAGLWVTDIEILRLHYADTLRHWRTRFLENLALVRELYGDRFCRMWEFYLASSEMAFRHGGLMVFQLQLARRVGTVPLTRDYMFDQERASNKEQIDSAFESPSSAIARTG
jgi:cyclopropane-fatty-acyl-phospholipid synthase